MSCPPCKPITDGPLGAGELDEWLQLEQPSATVDAAGQPTVTWTAAGRLAARVAYQFSDELLVDDQTRAIQRAIFEVRNAGKALTVRPTWRFTALGATWYVSGVRKLNRHRVRIYASMEDADESAATGGFSDGFSAGFE